MKQKMYVVLGAANNAAANEVNSSNFASTECKNSRDTSGAVAA